MRTLNHIYNDGETRLNGFLAYDDNIKFARPAVIVVHDWSGQNEFARKKAEKLAELGYVGFALDMYGDGQQGTTNEEKSALMKPLIEDRKALRQRIMAAYDEVAKLPQVDAERIAVIGFCFGGLCALDLARSGALLRGVVSFHGLLNPPPVNLLTADITAKILVLHGFDDPMTSPQEVIRFGEEMTQARVDWQIHMYGNTVHAFTNPLAHDANFGTVYNKIADQRSWLAMSNFLDEAFA